MSESYEMIRILHVDDEKLYHQMLKRNLLKIEQKIDFVWAESAKCAIRFLDEGAFDCILSDFQMPEMDGLEFLQIIREKGVKTPFIFLTGQGNEQIATEAFHLGVDDYFTKDAGFAHYERLVNSIKKRINAFEEKAEREKSEDSLNKLFTLTIDFLCIAGTDGYLKKINPTFSKILGYTEKELLETPLVDLIHPDDVAATFAEITKQMDGEHTCYFENRYRCKDGSYRLLAWSAYADTEEKLLYGIARDVTEAREAEENLRKEKDFTEKALNAQSDTFFVFDPIHGKPIRWNKAFTEISGYSNEAIAKMKAPYSWYSKEDIQRVEAAIATVLETGAIKIEMSLITKNGNRIPFEYSASLIRDENGAPQYIISVGRDVTDRKQKLKEKTYERSV